MMVQSVSGGWKLDPKFAVDPTPAIGPPPHRSARLSGGRRARRTTASARTQTACPADCAEHPKWTVLTVLILFSSWMGFPTTSQIWTSLTHARHVTSRLQAAPGETMHDVVSFGGLQMPAPTSRQLSFPGCFSATASVPAMGKLEFGTILAIFDLYRTGM